MKLVNYGIKNEQSDLRVHVCIKAKRIYMYETQKGVDMIKTNNYRKVSATQPGVDCITSYGYIIPPDDLDAICVTIPSDMLLYLPIQEDEPTSDKGYKASTYVKYMIESGIIPFKLRAKEITNYNMQISGVDIVVSLSKKIQVKCDYAGGHKEFGGTGNLFLQTQEINPLNMN